MKPKFHEIVLASASPRRSQLLGEMGLRFRVCPSASEELHDYICPDELVRVNAQLKAAAVAEQEPDALVLGADTTVALGDVILNKPRDMADAERMLMLLSGQSHQVLTGICFIGRNANILQKGVVTSEVTFKPLTPAIIREYFQQVNPLDKAGAYGIQTGRELIIENVHGSLHNVMGLPTEYLAELLAENGWLAERE